jgi:hypothetical protein
MQRLAFGTGHDNAFAIEVIGYQRDWIPMFQWARRPFPET